MSNLNQEYIDKYNNVVEKLDELTKRGIELQKEILKLMDEDNESSKPSLLQAVLNQTEFYNGHGQMEISSLHINQVSSLLNQLSESIASCNNIFYLALFNEVDYTTGDHYFGGSIYQCSGISKGEDKCWLNIGKIIMPGETDED